MGMEGRWAVKKAELAAHGRQFQRDKAGARVLIQAGMCDCTRSETLRAGNVERLNDVQDRQSDEVG